MSIKTNNKLANTATHTDLAQMCGKFIDTRPDDWNPSDQGITYTVAIKPTQRLAHEVDRAKRKRLEGSERVSKLRIVAEHQGDGNDDATKS